jgi:hypothetical protein
VPKLPDPDLGPARGEERWTGPALLGHVRCPCCGLPQPLTKFTDQLELKAQMRDQILLTCDECHKPFQVVRLERMLAVWTKPA